MKILPFLAILLVILLPVSYGQTSPPVYKLDTKTWPTEAIALDNIIKEIQVIPLETKPECFIAFVGHVLVTPGMIVMVDGNGHQVLCFDRKGKFLRKLGATGKGPGEFVNVSSILFNPGTSEILLYDYENRKINFYNMSGGFLRQSRLKSGGTEIKLINKDRLAIHATRMYMNPEKCELVVLNMKGEIEKTWFPYPEPIFADCCCGFAKGTQPNSVLYHKAFDYTIYEIFEDRVTKLLSLDFGSARLDSSKYMNTAEFFNAFKDKGKVLGFNLLANTPEHLAANIFMDNRFRGTWLLDHRTKNHQFLALDKGNLIGNYKGIPVSMVRQADESWFMSSLLGLNWNEAISKLSEAQKSILRKEVPGFIEAEKVTIDGNPVLVLYKFREF